MTSPNRTFEARSTTVREDPKADETYNSTIIGNRGYDIGLDHKQSIPNRKHNEPCQNI